MVYRKMLDYGVYIPKDRFQAIIRTLRTRKEIVTVRHPALGDMRRRFLYLSHQVNIATSRI
ncbi:MAG: hypothetical protein IH840_10360 [Candidatus Heimdallarchaeota archaeon]|nr:hypothetical protein [Candidatus Heimdallarchaeota archaeon]